MVAPGGVTLSGHFIPGETNIMASRMQLTDTFFTIILLLCVLKKSLNGFNVIITTKTYMLLYAYAYALSLFLSLCIAMLISNVSNVKVL